MNPARLLRLPAQLVRVARTGTPDAHGVPTEVTATSVVRCWAHQTARTERTGGVEVQDDTWAVYLPAGTVADGGDRLELGDVTLELTGPPWPAQHPTSGKVTHLEATGRRTR